MSMDYSGTPGEYIYSHNATGKSASGIIANGSTSERDLGAQRSAGGADRQAGDQGGHLIADRFGGRNDPRGKIYKCLGIVWLQKVRRRQSSVDC